VWMQSPTSGATLLSLSEAGNDDDETSFTTQVTFEEIFRVVLFIFSVHYAGELGAVIRCPELVGQIFAGVVLGPQVLDFVPFEESLVLLGEIGLIMLMFEAGIEVDTSLIKSSGANAVLMSILCAAFATGCGIGVGMALGVDFQGAFSIGATFAQTAIGTCMPVLQGGGLMNAPIGQMILAATMIDDMIALTLLSVMYSFGSGVNQSVFVYFIPIISSIFWMFVLGGLAIFVAPPVIDGFILSKIRRDHQNFVLCLLMAAVALAYMPLLNYTKSSYLMGASLAGMTFSQTAMGAEAFSQCRLMYDWLMKLFFAASIGFQIPVQLFRESRVWLYGMIFVFTAVLVKASALFFVPKFQQDDAMFNLHRRDQIVAGLSMMSRGGFGFLISASAFNAGLIGAEMYASVVLAILIATIFPSYAMNFAVMKFEELKLKSQKETKEEDDGKMPLFLRVNIETKATWGLQHQMLTAVSSIGLKVEDFRTEQVIGQLMGVKRAMGGGGLRSNYTRQTAQKDLRQRGTAMVKNVAITFYLRDDKTRIDIGGEGERVEQRLFEIRDMLVEKLVSFEPSIELSPWNPFDNFALEALNMLSSFHQGQTHEEGQSLQLFCALFSILDINGDNELTKEDLKSGLENLNINVYGREFDVLIRMMGAAGNDGVVTFDEWKNVISYLLAKKKKTLRVSTDESRNIIPTHDNEEDEWTNISLIISNRMKENGRVRMSRVRRKSTIIRRNSRG